MGKEQRLFPPPNPKAPKGGVRWQEKMMFANIAKKESVASKTEFPWGHVLIVRRNSANLRLLNAIAAQKIFPCKIS
jgi:hypothetical protein